MKKLINSILAVITIIIFVIVINLPSKKELAFERAFNSKLIVILCMKPKGQFDSLLSINSNFFGLAAKNMESMVEDLNYCSFGDSYRNGIIEKLEGFNKQLDDSKAHKTLQGSLYIRLKENSNKLISALKAYQPPNYLKEKLTEEN